MIDDYAKAMELVRKMEASLPIPARPTGGFIRAMKAQGVKIARDQELPIKSVLYMGDEGGISCDVTPPGMEKTPIVCSITHIRVKPSHPLPRRSVPTRGNARGAWPEPAVLVNLPLSP